MGELKKEKNYINSDLNDLALNKTIIQNSLYGTCPKENEDQYAEEFESFINKGRNGFCDKSFID